ncbi:MAG: histidine--tRNA ligase [Pyrinomonadaceae bacterium]
MSKTQPARGMRDFLPADVRRRNYVINIIKEVYESYGFEPLETPSVENLETLTGKYGEEGNQLIFKILKRGEKLQEELTEGKIKSENELSDLALRYDLTVPLARVVANNKNELPKFFKRYQIQPVWRADRPARGRYREFYQCDVDAIGSKSMIVEAELISAVCEILERLGFKNFAILINNRELLTGILNSCGVPFEKHTDALIAIDKIDKIGGEGVVKELISRGIMQDVRKFLEVSLLITRKTREFVSQYLSNNYEERHEAVSKNYVLNKDILSQISKFLNVNEKQNGISKLEEIIETSKFTSSPPHIFIEPHLARGLSYYTGTIMEIVVPDLAGSLGGGGRYDALIGMFGKEEIPACGFSLGLERILVVMEDRGMFPKELSDSSADVLVTVWNEETAGESLKLATELRRENLRVLVYPETDKLGKQFKYADSINIPFVCILGESELTENKVSLKNLKTGEQETISREEIAEKISAAK